MTDENIYYQWQNPALKETIYPRREAKLRHALEFYKEIDLWAQYKVMPIEELTVEIMRYQAYKKQAVQKSWEKYDDLLNNYFIVNIDDLNEAGLKDVLDKIKAIKDLPKKILDQIKADNDPPVKILNKIEVDIDLPAQFLNKIKTLYAPYVQNEILAKIELKFKGHIEKEYDITDAQSVSQPIFDKIVRLHKDFQDYFRDYKDAHKEFVFISDRLKQLDDTRKVLEHDIYAESMRLYALKTIYPENTAAQEADATKNNESDDSESEKLKELRSAQKLMDMERKLLSDLLAEHDKLEARSKERLSAITETQKSIAKLKPVQDKLDQQERKLKEIQSILNHLKTPLDRNLVEKYFSATTLDGDSVEKYFSTDSLKGLILDLVLGKSQKLDFGRIDMDREFYQYIGTITQSHKKIAAILQLPKDKDKLSALKPVLDAAVADLQDFKEKLEKDTAGYVTRFKEVCLKIAALELDRLYELKVVLMPPISNENEKERLIKVNEAEEQKNFQVLIKLRKDASDLQSRIDMFEPILGVTEEVYRREYVLRNFTNEDWKKEIVLWKTEVYKAWLARRNEYELLEEIIQRFITEPDRYPLWIQYMIIHFSGMRYKSAHGSWAEPVDLIKRLCSSHNARIKKDLTGLHLDKVDFKIMTQQQALDALESLVEKLTENEAADPKMPHVSKWLGKQIYEVTKLRINKATEPEKRERGKPRDTRSWEMLTISEQNERSSAESAPYRAIINDWKNAWFTNWREEHWHNKKMITSRAVCNEVAEYIQHLRGHAGAAGLASKPDWYRREENDYQTEYINKGMKFPDEQEPVFLYPRELDDYRVGASILWLRYKNSPAHDWDKVKPFTTSGGDQMVPAEYLQRKGVDGAWIYKDSGIYRTRTPLEKGKAVKKEYGFWLHEQTVAGVEETAEGRVLLTFETALPYDDPRVSAIGLTKHYEADVLVDYGEDSFNRFFVGFVPEKELPVKDLDDLKEMLNWNHILRDPAFMTEEKLKEYQEKHIRINAPPPIEIIGEDKSKIVNDEPFTGMPARAESIFYVKVWGNYGDDKDLAHLAGRDVNVIGTTNFQAVPLYTKKGGFGAVSQYIELDAAAMDYLKSVQIGKGLAFKQTMNWLIGPKPEGGNPDRPYWTEGGTWEGKWSAFKFGTIVFGGQMIQVEVDDHHNPISYKIEKEKYPSGAAKEEITFYKLIGLRRADMGKVTHLSHPWLIHQGTAAGKNNAYNRTPRGLTIYSPVWDPQDWSLNPKGEELFIAAEFLQKNDPANEIIVKVNDKYVDRIVVDILGADEKKAKALKEEADAQSAALKKETEIKTAALKKEADVNAAALKMEADIKSAVLKKETDVNSLSPTGIAEIKSAAQKRADEIIAAAKEREVAINDAVKVRAEAVHRAALKRKTDIDSVIKETEEKIRSTAMKSEKVTTLLKGKAPRNFSMVLRNLLNLVVDIE